MTNSKLAFLAILFFFAAIWLPMGQTQFLAEHWMKIGTYIAPILIFLGFKIREGSSDAVLSDVRFISLLMAAGYMAHQFEEHWIDLLGRHYSMYDFLNVMAAQVFGDDKYGIVKPVTILYINTGLVWTVAFLAIHLSPSRIFPALAMAGLMAINGLVHIFRAVTSLEYNPGLLTSIVVFLPLSLSFFGALRKSGHVSTGLIVNAVAWGFACHLVLFAAFAASVIGVFPFAAFYAFVIAVGFSPALLFRSKKTRQIGP